MAAPAGKGGATASALRAESRTPPSDLMEGPGLPRRGGAHSDTGPGGARWRGWAGRWLRSSAAPVPLNTPRPTWRTLNLDWPPLSANPSATAIPTLHRAGRGHGAARGERARRGHGGAGSGARDAASGPSGIGSAGRLGATGAGSGHRDRGRSRDQSGALISVCGTAPPAELCRGAALRSCRGEGVGAAPSPSPRGEPPLAPRLIVTALGNLGERGGEVPAPTFPASRGPDRGTVAPGSEFTPGTAGEAPRAWGGSDRGAAPGAPPAPGPGPGPAAAPPNRTGFAAVRNKGETRAPARKRGSTGRNGHLHYGTSTPFLGGFQKLSPAAKCRHVNWFNPCVDLKVISDPLKRAGPRQRVELT